MVDATVGTGSKTFAINELTPSLAEALMPVLKKVQGNGYPIDTMVGEWRSLIKFIIAERDTINVVEAEYVAAAFGVVAAVQGYYKSGDRRVAEKAAYESVDKLVETWKELFPGRAYRSGIPLKDVLQNCLLSWVDIRCHAKERRAALAVPYEEAAKKWLDEGYYVPTFEEVSRLVP